MKRKVTKLLQIQACKEKQKIVLGELLHRRKLTWLFIVNSIVLDALKNGEKLYEVLDVILTDKARRAEYNFAMANPETDRGREFLDRVGSIDDDDEWMTYSFYY